MCIEVHVEHERVGGQISAVEIGGARVQRQENSWKIGDTKKYYIQVDKRKKRIPKDYKQQEEEDGEERKKTDRYGSI